MLLHHVLKGRWAAVQNQSVRTWSRHLLLQHVFRDEADSLCPLLALVWLNVHCQKQLEIVFEVGRKVCELFLQQDVFGCAVSKNKRQLAAVLVEERSLDNLEARGDASATSNQSQLCLSFDHLLRDVEISEALILESSFRT